MCRSIQHHWKILSAADKLPDMLTHYKFICPFVSNIYAYAYVSVGVMKEKSLCVWIWVRREMMTPDALHAAVWEESHLFVLFLAVMVEKTLYAWYVVEMVEMIPCVWYVVVRVVIDLVTSCCEESVNDVKTCGSELGCGYVICSQARYIYVHMHTAYAHWCCYLGENLYYKN